MHALIYACVAVVPALASMIHIRVMQRRHDAERRLAGMRRPITVVASMGAACGRASAILLCSGRVAPDVT